MGIAAAGPTLNQLIVCNRSKVDITLRSEQLVDRLVEIGAIDEQPHRVAAVEPEARTVPVGQGAAVVSCNTRRRMTAVRRAIRGSVGA